MKIAIILIFTNILFSDLRAFVISKTESGQDVKWNINNKQIELFIDTKRNGINSSSLSTYEIQEIISSSISEWNQSSNFKIIPKFVSSRPSLGTRQTLSFSTNSAFFGAGTLGITSLGYDSATGDILTADILLNESFFNSIFFTDDPSVSSGSNAYLGDVLTHELGHFLGLGHSEVPGSSMTYSVFKAMYTVESDDQMGAKKLYGPTSGATISGRIIGENSIGVFGTNVNLISHSTGKIIANTISETNGSFSFKNLDDDDYVIYIHPIKSKSNLPKYYFTAINDYCDGSYMPTFFTKCGGRDRGRPQVISPESFEYIDVGNITIKCDSSHDPEYLLLKNQGYPEEYNLRRSGDADNAGQTFFGIFFKSDVENNVSGIEDKFKIDLTDVENSSGDRYLDLKFLTESLSSAVELEVSVKRLDLAAFIYYADTDSMTDKKELDMTIRYPLSTDSSMNEFEVTVTPKSILSSEKTEIFGTTADLINNQYYYSILQGVSEKVGSNYNLIATKDSTYIEDNSTCAEGVVSQTARAYISSAPINSLDDSASSQGLSCGTVDFDNNDSSPPWGGLGSFILGLMVIFMPLIKKHIPSILLS